MESPSLWIADAGFLRADCAAFEGPWPRRVFLAQGDQEYSGVRKGQEPQFDRWVGQSVRQLGGRAGGRGSSVPVAVGCECVVLLL